MPRIPAIDAGAFVRLARVDGDTVMVFEKLAILVSQDSIAKIRGAIVRYGN